MRAWVRIQFWGPFLESPEKFSGPKNPFVKVRPAYSVKLVFSYLVKGIKIKIIAKFRASRCLSFENTKRNYVTRNTPDKFRDLRETGPKPEIFRPFFRYYLSSTANCEDHSYR